MKREAVEKMKVVIDDITIERARQDAKWGEQNHSAQYWLGILGEEFGELCQAVNETVLPNADKKHLGGYEEMRKEAIHVAAVAVAFIECLDRHKEPEVSTTAIRCANCAHNSSDGCTEEHEDCMHYDRFKFKVEERVYRICSNCSHMHDSGNSCLYCNFPERSKFEEKR